MKKISVFLNKNKKILNVELWTIFMALKRAKIETKQNLEALLMVFTDLRKVLATS